MLFLVNLVFIFFTLLFFIIGLLISVAFFTLAERKFMGAIQRRKGPDVVGFWGLLQPLADGLKLILKELIFPKRATASLFVLGPSIVFVVSVWGWVIIPQGFSSILSNTSLDVFFSFVVSGLTVYGIIISGWSSNSRYSFFAAVRAIAQVISYELNFSMVNTLIGLFAGGFTYVEIVLAQQTVWFIFPLFPISVLYIILMLAETNRTPFDLVEAEAELVAGYNVEYSGIMFALFFLGEYSNMILSSVIFVIYFLGGWLLFPGFSFLGCFFSFVLKICMICIIFVWVRATLPRYRYDQLMDIGWKNALPLLFGFFVIYINILVTFTIKVDTYRSAVSFIDIYRNFL